MFKNYLKIALRNILRHKIYSFINITGLAIGIACCILIFLFIQNELGFDTFHKSADRIFRVNSVFNVKGTIHRQAVTQAPLGPAMKRDLPEIEYATRFLDIDAIVKLKDKTFVETLIYTDTDIFKMFSFPLLKGNPALALIGKNSVVISTDIEKKYFGDKDSLGKSIAIKIDDQFEHFVVSGVTKKIPENSSIQFDFLISLENLKAYEGFFSDWGLFSLNTYVQLKKLTNVKDVNTKIPFFIDKYVKNSRAKYQLQPLPDVHFGHNIASGMSKPGNIIYSYILAGIAFLILIIASINYMNITMAQSSVRYKEIGLRKVLGAVRWQVMKQFWGEAILMSCIAFLLGLGLAEFFLPVFNSLIDKSLYIHYPGNWYWVLGIFVFILLVAFLTNMYPAVVLSKFKPVETIKGIQNRKRNHPLTRALIIFQYAISIFLIVCTGVIMKQLGFMKNKNLGFESENVLVLPVDRCNGKHVLKILRNKLDQYTTIKNIAGSNRYPGGGCNGTVVKTLDALYNVNIARIDYNFLDLFDMKLKQGRNFSPNIVSDSRHAVIINETLLKDLGWESAAGKKLTMNWGGLKDVKVIGVVKNFHFTSLHEEIEPLVFYINQDVDIKYIFIKIKPGGISGTIALLKNMWHTIVPDNPFEYFFLQEEFHQLYQSEESWSKIFKYSSSLALILACFGLFGLSALVITNRSKEIGIRKVLGSSVPGIALLLSKEFILLVCFANIIAWPFAYYAMNRWLQDFAYRTHIGIWIFFISGVLSFFIALLTISIKSVRAALANPVEVLNDE